MTPQERAYLGVPIPLVCTVVRDWEARTRGTSPASHLKSVPLVRRFFHKSIIHIPDRTRVAASIAIEHTLPYHRLIFLFDFRLAIVSVKVLRRHAFASYQIVVLSVFALSRALSDAVYDAFRSPSSA